MTRIPSMPLISGILAMFTLGLLQSCDADNSATLPPASVQGSVAHTQTGLLYQSDPTDLSIVDVAILLATLQSDAQTPLAIAERANDLLDADLVSSASLNPIPTELNSNFVEAGDDLLNIFDVAAVLARIQVGSDPTALATRINDLLDVDTVQASDILSVPGSGFPSPSPLPSSSPSPSPSPALSPSPSPLPSPSPSPNPANGQIDLEFINEVTGFRNPLYLTHAGDGSDRLFVVEQGGLVRIVDNQQILPTPFLDISDRTDAGGERGLLSIAFPPDYATTGYFIVSYTDLEGDSVIARYTVSANPNVANQAEQVILRLEQPFTNHNGGLVKFGPDGFLYIAFGDGGGSGDPQNNAQNSQLLLGKLLRIDVEGGSPYAVPSSNPFVDNTDFRDEIWAWGLRNPWRFSFDRMTGDLFIGDVGQERFEEINIQPQSSPGGENYGWRITEGESCFNPPFLCNRTGLTSPVVVYGRSDGASVTGGYVYRGSRYPDMVGTYFYGDFISQRLWGLPSSASTPTLLLEQAGLIASFGEDESGELYLVDYLGRIVQLADDPEP